MHQVRRAVSLVALAACGSAVDQPSAVPDDVEETAASLDHSPWLVTVDLPPRGMGPLRAQRFHGGQLERVLLDPSALWPSWSPNGRWLAYETMSDPERDRTLWMRRLDGDAWQEPQLVSAPEIAGDSIIPLGWSPTRAQLLFEVRRSTRTRRFALATAREDGSVGVDVLYEADEGDRSERAEWSSTGEYVAITVERDAGREVTIHDVGRGEVGGPWPSRALVAPTGTAFDSLGYDGNSGRGDAFSADERWIAWTVRAGTERPSPKTVLAFPASGEDAPRVMSSCGAPTETTSCQPWSWHPQAATLLVVRRDSNERVVWAWSPDTGAEVSLGDVEPERWLAPRDPRLLMKPSPNSRRLSILDLRDIAAPVMTDVPTTDATSFREAQSSPDGRWLLLFHAEYTEKTYWIDVLDLHGPPPWPRRELYRLTTGINIRSLTWSPSSTFVLIDEDTGVPNRKRAHRIQLATDETSPIDVRLGPVPSNFTWSWDHIAPDESLLVIPRGGGLALWPVGAPLSAAAKLGDTPEWAIASWRPSNDP